MSTRMLSISPPSAPNGTCPRSLQVRIGDGFALRLGQRQSREYTGAAFGPGARREGPAKLFGPLAHRDQADSRVAVGRQPYAVVANLDLQASLVDGHSDEASGCSRVPHH